MQASFMLMGILALLCGLVVAVHTVRLAILSQSSVLLADEWRVLPRYIEFTTGKLSLLSFLWEDHFGHRPALARLLFILDVGTMGGTQVLPKLISIFLCGLVAVLFAMLLMRQKEISLGARLIGVGLLVLVFLVSHQIHNFSIGWNNAILTTVWFSVLAFYCLTKSIERTASGHRAVTLFVCALLSGIAATCSMANGLLIWPIMLLMCVRFRAWPRATIVTLVGAAMTTIYLWNYKRMGLLSEILNQPGALLDYLFAFLGNPAMAFGMQASTFFGVLGILLVGYHFCRQGWHSDRDAPTVWFLLCVCLFVIGTAALTSIGRISFGAEVGIEPSMMSAIGPLSLRYYSFIAPLWAAILLLGFMRLKQNSQNTSGGVLRILDTTALVVSVGMCASTYSMSPGADWLMLNRYERFERAASAIVAGAPDQNVLKSIYPFPDINILSLVPYLASSRLSIFHSDVDYFLYQKAHDALHKPLSDGMLLDGKWCTGSIDDLDKVESVGRNGATWNRLSGWTSERETSERDMQRPADGVLFADEEGRLVGIGRMIFTYPDVDRIFDLRHARLKIHYIGYVEIGASLSVIGYAFKAGQNDLCQFGEQKIRQ